MTILLVSKPLKHFKDFFIFLKMTSSFQFTCTCSIATWLLPSSKFNQYRIQFKEGRDIFSIYESNRLRKMLAKFLNYI